MPTSNPFQKAEDEYFRLEGQLAAERITREQFDASLKEVMIQDEQGRWWMLGVDSGKIAITHPTSAAHRLSGSGFGLRRWIHHRA